MRLTWPSTSSRTCRAVIRLSFAATTLPSLPTMSKRAISPLQPLGHEVELRALGAQVERVELEELLEDVLVREADRLQQRGHRHLAAAVDAEEQEVLRVELEVQPRAAVGNHAGREQELAGRVRLAAVVLEEHARRAVELRHDHALGAVDDERAVLGHERDLAHVDLLLLHLLHRVLRRRFLVHDDQPDLGAQRGAVREAALLALDDVERRRQQREADELEAGVARVARDREDRRERGLQAFVLARVGRGELLQERAIRRELRFEEERHLEHARALREALADALLLGKGVGRSRGSRHSVGSSHLRFVLGPRGCRADGVASGMPRSGDGRRILDASTVREPCIPRFGGWPLPAAGGQRRRCSDVRPTLPSAVDSESERSRLETAPNLLRFDPRSKRGGTEATAPLHSTY